MRAVRRFNDHTVIVRSIADKTIQARDPQLIKLPIPLPSVPILSPLLSPLIGGSNSNAKTTTTAAPAPATSPTPSSSSNTNSGSSSSGSSNTGTTGTGDSGSSSGSSSGGSTSSGSASSGSTGGNSGGSSSSSSGSTTGGTSSGSTGGGTSTPSTGSGSTTSGGTVSSGSGNLGSSNSTLTGGSLLSNSSSGTGGTTPEGSTSSSGTGANGGTSSSSNGGAGGIANAGNLPSTAGGNSSGSSTGVTSPSTGANGSQSSTLSAGGSSGGNSTDGSAVDSASKHHISAGVVAAIVVLLLFLIIGILVFVFRRRSRARRDERANTWWFSRKRTSQTYGDRNSAEILPSGARSARSSFATTIDHSRTPLNGSFIIPPLPPMAEVGRANGTAPTFFIDASNFNSPNDPRFSIGSHASDNSQYLVVNHRDSMTVEGLTPTSVRPFSPSESFAFPKPPDPAGDRNSRPASTATLAHKSTRGSLYEAGAVPPTPSVPPTPAMPTISVAVSDPFADNNPFDDAHSAPAHSNASTGDFADVEYIRRPFDPNLIDELKVRPDDAVRVIQSFDDGWALVEKVHPGASSMGKGKEKEADCERGLIPIDCLREPGQALPAFFAAKRVSSYAGSVVESQTFSAI